MVALDLAIHYLILSFFSVLHKKVWVRPLKNLPTLVTRPLKSSLWTNATLCFWTLAAIQKLQKNRRTDVPQTSDGIGLVKVELGPGSTLPLPYQVYELNRGSVPFLPEPQLLRQVVVDWVPRPEPPLREELGQEGGGEGLGDGADLVDGGGGGQGAGAKVLGRGFCIFKNSHYCSCWEKVLVR